MEESNITDEFLITKEFKTANEFSLFIEGKAVVLGLSCIEIITDYCERKDIDTSAIVALVTPSLKEKIRIEGEDLRLLKRTSEALPI
jgi:hypothetical protein